MFPEEDYLQMSGVQHYCYCPRQWGLIHIAQIWSDDARTISGNIMHRTADDPFSERNVDRPKRNLGKLDNLPRQLNSRIRSRPHAGS